MDFEGLGRWTPASTKCLIKLTYKGKKSGVPERIRTSDLWIRSPTLYPAELQARRQAILQYPRLEVNREGRGRTQGAAGMRLFLFHFIVLTAFWGGDILSKK